jgi:hypothetical protein
VRGLLGTGLVLVGLGLLLMHGLDSGSDWTALLPGFLVAGAGIGMVNPALATAAVGVVDPMRSGMASGINNTFRQVGIATGIAALGAIFQARVESRLHDALGDRAGDLAQAVASGGNGLQSVPAAQRARVTEAAHNAFIAGLNEIFLVAVAIALAGAVFALVLVRNRDFVPHGAAEQAAAA